MRQDLFFFAPPDDASTQGNSQAGAGSSRTPFDNSLLHDPGAPRDTQPLSPINTANTAAPATTPPVPASRTVPPQVVPGARISNPSQDLSKNDDDSYQVPAPNNPTRKLPTSTLVGMSMAGGAVVVLLLSLLVRNNIPSPKTPESQTPGALPPATVDIKQRPGIVMTPDGETTKTTPRVPSQSSRKSQSEKSSAEVTITPEDAPISSPDVVDNSGDEVVESNNSEVSDSTVVEVPDTRTSSRSPQRSASTRNEDNRESIDNTESSRSEQTPPNTQPPVRDAEPGDRVVRNNRPVRDRVVNGRWTSARHGYSIAPPEGFRLRRTGRRTAWRGPNGSEILVEVGTANGSPRSGWESLDRTLSKKYGQKYRSRGIREVIINGKDAAIWEFDLDTRNGTVRKIDVAMHDGKRGYAVLGSAPVDNFDAMRSQIESAVNSFRIEDANDRSRASNRSDDDAQGDDESEGY